MAFTAPVGEGGGEREQCPAGSRIGRLIRIIDMGTTQSQWYKNEKTGDYVWSHKVLFMWELPNTPMANGKPFGIMKKYTRSLNEKANLRKDIASWLGKSMTDEEAESYDIGELLEKPAMISVVPSKDGKFSNVGGVMAVPDGMSCPERVNESYCFDLSEFDSNIWIKLSETLRGKIKESLEFKAMEKTEKVFDKTFDKKEDIPF